MKWLPGILYGVFLATMLVAGLIATETRSLLQWPAFVGFGALGALLLIRWKAKLQSPPADLCLAAAVLFTGYIVIRGIMSPVAYYAREDISVILACLVVYLLTATHFSSKKMRMGVVWTLLALGIINVAVGLVHLSGNWEFHILPGFSRNFEHGRIGGLFNNADHMAAFMLIVLCLSLSLAIFGRNPIWRRNLYIVLSVIAVAAILLTKSRGALLGAGLGIGSVCLVSLFFIHSLNRQIFPKVLAGMGLIALVGIAFLAFLYSTVVDSRFKGDGPKREEVRLHFWKAAWDQHLESPLVGTGSRSHYDYCRKYRPEAMHSSVGDALFVHNEYLQLLADYGWIGVGIFLLFVILHFKNGTYYLRWLCKECRRRGCSAKGSRPAVTIGALTGLVALLGHAIVEFHMHIPAVALGASFCLGVMANPGIGRSARRPFAIPSLRPVFKVGMAAAGCWLVLAGIRYMPTDLAIRNALVSRGEEGIDTQRLEALEKVMQLDPKNHHAFKEAADTRVRMISSEMPQDQKSALLNLAIAELLQAESLNPNDIFILMNLADVLTYVGRADEAEPRLRRALEWAPLYENVRLSWALFLHRTGRLEEADQAYLAVSGGSAYPMPNWWEFHRVLRREMESTRPSPDI